MIFRVNALNSSRTVCAGNGSDPMPPAFSRAPYIPAANLTADPTGETGQNFFVAVASRMSGPWRVRKVEVTATSASAVLGSADVHISNNALFFPTNGSAAFARGCVGMAFRRSARPPPQ